MNPELEFVFRKEWYVQAAESVPALTIDVMSQNIMRDGLGDQYSVFYMGFQDDYCKLGYPLADFKRHSSGWNFARIPLITSSRCMRTCVRMAFSAASGSLHVRACANCEWKCGG